jgi:hypothetical protein
MYRKVILAALFLFLATAVLCAAEVAAAPAATVDATAANSVAALTQQPAAALDPAAKSLLDAAKDPERLKDAAVTVLIFLLAIFLMLFGVYIFCSVCLQLIAKKTARGREWMAWVPVAQLLLMCRLAGISCWWAALVILMFIPYLGLLFSMVFFTFIWYRIALARNKPGWLAFLGAVPFVGLLVMGYLAFSD